MGINERLWYQKKPVTINSKLRQAIMDTLPFDIDKDKADVILRAIFDSIIKGVKRDRFVTINGLGRFSAKYQPARPVPDIVERKGRRISKIISWRIKPAHYEMRFKPCAGYYAQRRKEEAEENA